MTDLSTKVVYWHRELPPLSAEIWREDVVEAASLRVKGSLAHRDDAWDRCYADLIERARVRIEQETARRGASFAHVRDEDIGTRHDDASGETWLAGRFGYMLYRKPMTDDQ